MHSYSLFELNEYIKRVIALNFQEPLWINAEISQVKEVRGQVYLELVEHDEVTDSIKAKSPAVIWYKSYLFIRKKLGELLTPILAEGSHVLVKVNVEFHERYGMKLVIEDIDASYTIGQMQMARQKILERLEREEILHLNKMTVLSTVIQKVAVISSGTAAGYIDFKNQVAHNSYSYDIKINLFQAAMQGQNVEREVVQALRKIKEDGSYDCVTIIRGGGSKLDLSWFDNYNIAHAIAHLGIPVLSGIGHDIDQSVTDIVSYNALKTPTAVADYLLEHNLKFESDLIQKGIYIQNLAKHLISNQKLQLRNYENILQHKPRELTKRHRELLKLKKEQILQFSRNMISRSDIKLNHIEQLLLISDPANVVKKGYAIIHYKNEIITDSQLLKKDSEVTIEMRDGSKNAKII